jgi:hypothetical protein
MGLERKVRERMGNPGDFEEKQIPRRDDRKKSRGK